MTALAIFCTILTLGMVTQEVIKNNRQINHEMKMKMLLPTINESADEIVNGVCEASGVTIEQIKSKSRKREIVIARQIIQFMIAEKYKESNVEINHKLIGEKVNRDRTGVYYSISQVEGAIKVRDRYVMDIINKYHGNRKQAA